ncbi:MAG: TolC family protein [Bryobacterales bacterium]|nr:TolC family protein [Bryobacterales bacterium]
MKVVFLVLLAAAAHGEVLSLRDVLQSVEKSYPPLLAALQEKQAAEGDLLSAMGRFDTTFRARFDTDQIGFYDNERIDLGFEQATTKWGSSYFGGWRLGEGSFAPYDGKLDTRSYGEFRAGMRLPLLRDRSIDSRRADVRKADLNRRLAALSIDQQKIVILQTATRRYWEWVAAGRRYAVAEQLLDLAMKRNDILKESVRLGQTPAIEVAENERAILQRRSQLVEAERALQLATIDLSLFYRTPDGKPRMAAAEQLPGGFPEQSALTPEQISDDIETALRRRPEVERLIVQRRQTEVDAALGKNQRLPNVDVLLSFTREGGTGAVRRGPTELKGSLIFELPLQRRAAEGRILNAEARLNQIEQRQQFTSDQITAEVQDAISAVQTAYRRARLIGEEVQVARQLEDAERTKFDLGDSTLFLVNLREQATFDAAVREVAAQADYFRAQALYELAIAEALAPTRAPAVK